MKQLATKGSKKLGEWQWKLRLGMTNDFQNTIIEIEEYIGKGLDSVLLHQAGASFGVHPKNNPRRELLISMRSTFRLTVQ